MLAAQTTLTNLCDRQLSGYNFLSYGQVGDQPGRHAWHYLTSWQYMPNGAYIAGQKFNPPSAPALRIFPWEQDYHNGQSFPISCFTNTPLATPVPFPTDDATNYPVYLPCIAFDYTGRLISEVDASGNFHDAYIPLSQGSIIPAHNGNTKTLQLAPADVLERPPGNTTDIRYNVIHVDALTGRCVLEYHKLP